MELPSRLRILEVDATRDEALDRRRRVVAAE